MTRAPDISPGVPMQGPLQDVIVLDLSRALAGPHCAMMLGDLGAQVIKVEPPGPGDDTRGWGPPFVTPDNPVDAVEGAGAESTYFMSCNRNKASIVIDLKSQAGTELLSRLIRQSDVLVENFRPGVLDRLGFGTDHLQALNPRLVIVSITGFGNDGPEAARSGYDQIAQGEAGIMSLTGDPDSGPTRVGVPIADVAAGMYAAFGAVSALLARNRTGRGEVVRTSLLTAMIGMHAYHGTNWTVAGVNPGPVGGHHPSICPYGLYTSATGHVQIAIGSEKLWRALCAAFPALDRPEWATNSARVASAAEVNAAVNRAFRTLKADELLELLISAGIPAGKVRSIAEVYQWDQSLSQGAIIEVDHATLGRITLPGPPVRFEHESRTDHAAPPVLGQNAHDVVTWLERRERADATHEN